MSTFFAYMQQQLLHWWMWHSEGYVNVWFRHIEKWTKMTNFELAPQQLHKQTMEMLWNFVTIRLRLGHYFTLPCGNYNLKIKFLRSVAWRMRHRGSDVDVSICKLFSLSLAPSTALSSSDTCFDQASDHLPLVGWRLGISKWSQHIVQFTQFVLSERIAHLVLGGIYIYFLVLHLVNYRNLLYVSSASCLVIILR